MYYIKILHTWRKWDNDIIPFLEIAHTKDKCNLLIAL
jgi:hypothetical protein